MGRRRKAWLWGGDGRRPNRSGYYVRFYDYTKAGQRVHHTRQFLKHADARRFMVQYNARHDLRQLDRTIPMTITECIDDFLDDLDGRAESTVDDYAQSLGKLARIIGDTPVCDVTGDMIDQFTRQRLKRSSEATAAKHLRVARRFFLWAGLGSG